jgi:predicted component of type VI protein secretion system
MEATLVVVEGEAVAPQFQLNLPAIIGRSRNADVKIGHPLVSRQHCELFEADGTLMVRDLGSLNGTFVGDTRIASETSLEPGGLLTIGSVTFRAEYEAAAREAGAEDAGAFAPFAPLAAGVADLGEETVQMGGMPSMESLEEPAIEAEAEGFGWLGDDEGAAVAEVPVEAAPAAEEAVEFAEEELSFDEPEAPAESDEMTEMAEVADDLNIEQADELNFDLDDVAVEENAAASMSDVAEEPQELELSFDDPDETQAAPVAAAPPVEEEPVELDIEEIAVEETAAEEVAIEEVAVEEAPVEEAPVAEDEFSFAPPEDDQGHEAGGEEDGDLD